MSEPPSHQPATIRRATADDQSRIRRIVRGARLYPFGLQWRHFLVAEVGGEVAGVGQIRPYGDGCRELASLAVLPPYQGQGIGSSLVLALLEQAARPVHLMCAGKLTSYYARFGFAEIDPVIAPKPLRRKALFGNRLIFLLSLLLPTHDRVAVMALLAS